MNCRFHNVPPPCPECSTDGYIPETDIATEHRRMLLALEAIQRIVDDMLDPVRRAGPK